jgi:hypothetical protein
MMDPVREAAAAAVARTFEADPDGSGAMGQRIRDLELALAWTLGVAENASDTDLSWPYETLLSTPPETS